MPRIPARILSAPKTIKIKARSPPVGLNILRKLEETLANQRIPLPQKKERVHPLYQELFKLKPKDLAEEHYSISWVRERYVQQEVARRTREVAEKVGKTTKMLARMQEQKQKRIQQQQLRALSPSVIRWGEKRVWLPRAVVTLLRPRSRQSPFTAWFRVPLEWSKFDLRDYLFHGYGVKATNIGVYVQQQPVQDSHLAPRKWFRPKSRKFMVIEMDQPFVWPKDPDDGKPWGTRKYKEKMKEMEEEGKEVTGQGITREHAGELLTGKVTWEPAPSPFQPNGPYKIRV